MTYETLGKIAAVNAVGTMCRVTAKEGVTLIRPKSSPYFGAFKVRTYTTHAGCDYSAWVNRELAREGKDADYVAKKVTNMEVIHPMIAKNTEKGTFYFRHDERCGKTLETHYFHADGTEMAESEVADMKENWTRKPTDYAKTQGTDDGKAIRIKTALLDNIREIQIGGVTYQ